MARPLSLTAANCVIFLTIPGVYGTPQQIQQFAADDVADHPSIRSAETAMGVDGVLSGGFVFVPIPQTIVLQANSPSNDVFDAWWSAQQQADDVFNANGSITLNSIGKKWNFVNGFLTGYVPLPPIRRTLQPRRYEIMWNGVQAQPSNVRPIA